MATGGDDAVLEGVAAEAADAPVEGLRVRRRAGGGRRVDAAAGRAVDDQVGVVHGLAQPDEQVEDVGVVVEHRAALDVPAHRHHALSETVPCSVRKCLPRLQ